MDFLAWGIDCIRALQRPDWPALTAVMRAITLLGDEKFFLLVLPFLWFTRDWKISARIALFLLSSTLINAIFKQWLEQPRPGDLAPELKLAFEEGYGLPSGHSQSSMVFWFAMAALAPAGLRGRAWAGAAVITLAVGFSRVYLGVHFPTDVFVGWALAGLLLLVYFHLRLRIEDFLSRMPAWALVLLAFGWGGLAFALVPPNRAIVAVAGALAGIGLGILILSRWLEFPPPASTRQTAVRLILGLGGTVAIYVGLNAALPPDLGFRYVRYFAVTLWVAAIAPFLLRALFEPTGRSAKEPRRRSSENAAL